MWKSLDGAANRTAMTARIEASEMDGFLAYVGRRGRRLAQRAAAHQAAALLRADGHSPRRAAGGAARSAAVIVCFVIAPAWRRRGVARALLAGALASFAARGHSRWSMRFPSRPATSTQATDHYHGPSSLFRDAGFDVLSEHKDLTVMRKRFAAPH